VHDKNEVKRGVKRRAKGRKEGKEKWEAVPPTVLARVRRSQAKVETC